jgi:hypothetical protein
LRRLTSFTPSTDFTGDTHTSGSKAGYARLKFYLRNSSCAVGTFCYCHKDKEAKFGYFTATIANLAAVFMVCTDNLFFVTL